MSDTHVPPLRAGHRGDALRGLDWVIISGPISEDFALRIASLCFLGPAMDYGDGAACYRRRPEIARQTRRRTLVIQRHGEGEDAPTEGSSSSKSAKDRFLHGWDWDPRGDGFRRDPLKSSTDVPCMRGKVPATGRQGGGTLPRPRRPIIALCHKLFNCSGYTDNPGIVQPEPEALGDLRHERGGRHAGSGDRGGPG